MRASARSVLKPCTIVASRPPHHEIPLNLPRERLHRWLKPELIKSRERTSGICPVVDGKSQATALYLVLRMEEDERVHNANAENIWVVFHKILLMYVRLKGYR